MAKTQPIIAKVNEIVQHCFQQWKIRIQRFIYRERMLIYALLEAANDSDDDVSDAVFTSLRRLGSKNPNLLLDIGLKYLKKNEKLPARHRNIVFFAMVEVCKGQLNAINSEIAKEVIQLCVEEMIKSKVLEICDDFKSGASSALVALGNRFCIEVMESLHSRFQPGIVPHYFVVKTLGNLSVENVFGMVPFLKTILQTTLTIIGILKADYMRYIFTHAIAKFSEAIIEYIANIEKSPDQTVRKEVFSTELSIAYGTMVYSWLQSKDIHLRIGTVRAIGYMCQLLSKEKLDEELPRLITGILVLFKRIVEDYFVSQALARILESAINNCCTCIEPVVDNILANIFPAVCIIVDYSEPTILKHQGEVLRCYAILGRVYSDNLITFIIQKVENSNERMRIGGLQLLRHLINSPESRVCDKIATILASLKPLLSESNNNVKKVLAQVIVALAHHGYLELDGSQAMTEFIIQQCALSNEPVSPKKPVLYEIIISNSELRSMCENILNLLATTVESVSTVFWPNILEFLMSERLTNAVGIVCKCATHLGNKKKQDQSADYEIDFDKRTNLPKPVQLIARLLVLLGQPKVGKERGIHILKLMQILIPSMEKNLVATWDAAIPTLLRYLEEQSSEQWVQSEWEKMVLKLLADSIAEVDRQDWTALFSKTLGEQISLYAQYPNEKSFLFKCLGIALKKCNNRQLVSDLLDIIFRNVNHSMASDREGCAVAVGYCAATHMDAILVKLDHLARVDLAKKSGIFGFFMEMKGEFEHEIWKATIILCYGHVARCAPPTLLTARIESPMLRNVNGYFSLAKDPMIRLSLIKMTEMFAVSLHSDNLRERYLFRSKDELIRHMQTFIKLQKGMPLKNAIVSLAIDACCALIKLDPILQSDQRLPLLITCYETVFSIPPSSAPDRAKAERYEDDEEHEILLTSTFNSLLELLKELLIQDISANNFYNLFVSMEIWLMSSKLLERERAIKCVFVLSKCFMDNLPVVLGASFTFDSHGAIIARLVPRCTDSSKIVRELAFSSVYNILKILTRHNGFNSDHVDRDVELLQEIKQKAMQDNPDVLYNVSVDLAKILSIKLSVIQLRVFLDVLMEGLVDKQDHSSSGACVVLNHVLKNKAGVLQQELETLLQLLHTRLNEISYLQTRRGTLQIIRTLANFQLTPVINCLLSYSLPFDEHVTDWWRTLSQDSQINGSVIDQFCEIVMRSAPYLEYPDPRNMKEVIRVGTPKVVAIISAMQIMFCQPEMEPIVIKEYPKLFSILLSMIGCFHGVYPPSVLLRDADDDPHSRPMIALIKSRMKIVCSSVAAEAFKAFLVCTKSNLVCQDLESIWEKLDKESDSPDVNAYFAKFIAINYPHYLPGVVTCFNPMLSSSYDSQRIAAVAFFAELLHHHSLLDQTALELLLNNMLGRLLDNSRAVRRLAIRGLGSVGKLDVEHMDSLEWFGVYKYSNTVLSAMMSGLDDKDDPHGEIALEAMKGLCKVLADMDKSHVESALINIIMRLRPCFESENVEIRAASYKLFGVLAQFCNNSEENTHVDQLHGNLVSLLLHLNDEDKQVIKACKSALRSVGPHLGSDSVNEMFQRHLIDDSQLYYREFMADLSKIMVTDFTDRISLYVATCVSYFKSSWSVIKANAAMFAGFLLGHIPEELRPSLTNVAVFGALTKLLRDSSPDVRTKVAEAISQLHSY